MTPTTPQALLILAAVAAVLFLIHRFAPASGVAKAEDTVLSDMRAIGADVRARAAAVEPALERGAQAMLTEVETWLTDETAANAKRAQAAALVAEADADTARRQGLLRAHIATLSAKLPAA